jgi:predicted nucleic acid-binding Zn ribbon protein
LLSARGWRERAAVGAVFGHWQDIVGPQLALHSKPESFDSGELTVSADSPAWATQLRLMAPQLLKRLAEELGHNTVRHIRVNGPSGPPRRPGRLRVRLPAFLVCELGVLEENGPLRRSTIWTEPA